MTTPEVTASVVAWAELLPPGRGIVILAATIFVQISWERTTISGKEHHNVLQGLTNDGMRSLQRLATN